VDYLVDTNLWLRALAVSHPMKPVARHAIKTLLRSGADLCVAPQNLVELWSVCTRPEKDNGFGKTIAAADRYCRYVESFVSIIPETPELFAKWRELVVTHQVAGKKVFDTRLAAVMILHRVPRILTFNTKDFTRYTEIEATNPEAV
jgi:predicted nucleic acid-binding protein